MLSRWTDWKAYPRLRSGENIIAPLSPGVFEVRVASSGATFAFSATTNLAKSLAELTAPKSIMSWFTRREPQLPDLEYRMFATRSWADARIAAEQMSSRRETYLRGAA